MKKIFFWLFLFFSNLLFSARLELVVINSETEGYIEEAEVELTLHYKSRKNEKKYLFSNEIGICMDEINGDVNSISAVVRKPGFIPKSIYIQKKQEEDCFYHEVSLFKGVKVGGISKDLNGKLLPGVNIKFFVDWKNSRLNCSNNEMLEDLQKIQTDKNGRWEAFINPDNVISINIEDGDERFFLVGNSRISKTSSLTQYKELIDNKYELSYVEGFPVRGVVLLDNQPIEGAKVFIDYPRLIGLTDSKGFFDIGYVKPQTKRDIYAWKKGLCVGQLNQSIDNPDTKIIIRTEKTEIFSGKVVDKNGKPLSDFEINSDFFPEEIMNEMIHKGDEDGVFYIETPPPNISLNITAPKMIKLSSIPWKELIRSREIVLYPCIDLEARVIDADTGVLIPEFIYDFTSDYGGHGGYGSNGLLKTSIKGIKWGADKVEFSLTVSAEGYFSEKIKKTIELAKAGDKIFLEILTKKAETIEGTVKNPDGTPASNVLIRTPKYSITLDKILSGYSYSDFWNEQKVVKSDKDGKFAIFCPKNIMKTLLIANEYGIKILSFKELKENPNIKLSEWAGIKGKVPFYTPVRAEVEYKNEFLDDKREFVNFRIHMDTETNSNGLFYVEKVPPGYFRLMISDDLGNEFHYPLAFVSPGYLFDIEKEFPLKEIQFKMLLPKNMPKIEELLRDRRIRYSLKLICPLINPEELNPSERSMFKESRIYREKWFTDLNYSSKISDRNMIRRLKFPTGDNEGIFMKQPLKFQVAYPGEYLIKVYIDEKEFVKRTFTIQKKNFYKPTNLSFFGIFDAEWMGRIDF